jgi:hypothetical protein
VPYADSIFWGFKDTDLTKFRVKCCYVKPMAFINVLKPSGGQTPQMIWMVAESG